MKITVPLSKHTVPCMFICLLFVLALSSFAAEAPDKVFLSLPYFDSIVVEKQFTSKKYRIRLYPSAKQQVLFFSASGEEGKIYQLFLFDMDGRLVKQANIKNKQTTVINIIDKGVYLFEVFIEDKRIENGKVTVR